MAGIYSQGGSAGHRYAGWLSEVEAKNFIFGGKVFNGSPSAIYVGSNLVWTYWLKYAAMNAILGAFGQTDGTAVINATNAYLTQLAASGQAGKDKATALASYINEDPMMVCSLGLQPQGVTMPIRWLRSANGAAIDTLYVNNSEKVRIRLKTRPHSFDSTYYTYRTCGAYDGTRPGMLYLNTSSPRLGFGNADIATPFTLVQDQITDCDVTAKNNALTGTFNGSAINFTYSGSLKCIYSISLFAIHDSTGNAHYAGDTSFAIFEYYSDDVKMREMYPFIRKIDGVDKLGMLDVLNDAFYQNIGSGSFTIEYTLPDGTPWTPLNQQ